MNKILLTFFLIFPAGACKQENPSPDRNTVLREFIQEYGHAECAKKEIDQALQDCNSEKDCVFNQLNANCYAPDPSNPK